MMFARKCLASGLVVATGDGICQMIEGAPFDVRRNVRFAIAGATLHAPFWLYGFKLIDKLPLGGIGLMSAVRRTLATQILLSPPYFVLFYGWIGVLEGLNPRQIVEFKTRCVVDTVIRGLMFWPFVNVINFQFVAATHRLHYVTAAGVIWNVAVSYTNNRS